MGSDHLREQQYGTWLSIAPRGIHKMVHYAWKKLLPNHEVGQQSVFLLSGFVVVIYAFMPAGLPCD